jgi:hypothetical protein
VKPRLSLEEKLELAYSEWNASIAGLSDADFDLMVYPKWDLKDVLGQVFAYLHLAVQHVKSYKRRKRLASPNAPSYAYFNRREAERLRSVPLALVRRDMDAAFHELRALVPTLSSADLNRQFPAQWTNSKYKTTLRYLLRSMAEGMQTHACEVKSWRVNVNK